MKPFKTIDEQVEILKGRGLKFENEELEKRFLYFNNYYRISGYSLTLRKHDVFYKNTTFKNIMDIYNFDYELRHILFTYIEEIEVGIKSIYAHEFSRAYGPLGHLNCANFTDSTKYSGIVKKANAEIDLRVSSEAFLRHFINDENGEIPLWAYVDLLTISDVSKLYQITSVPIKIAVAEAYNMTAKGSDYILGEYLHCVTILRNLCAHGSRLFNRLFIRKPNLSKKDKQLLAKEKNGTVDNSHLYSYILVMRRLLDNESFMKMKAEISKLNDKYPFVAMRYYGFRSDWKKAL